MTTHESIKWIENLADQENRIGLGESSNLDLCATKDEVLSFETLHFLQGLDQHFRYLTQLFNARLGESLAKLKYSRLAEAIDGFYIQRNMKRLLVTRPQNGAIQLQCERVEAADGSGRGSLLFSSLVEARFEAFHQIRWYYLGSPVQAEAVARHHITEFIRS